MKKLNQYGAVDALFVVALILVIGVVVFTVSRIQQADETVSNTEANTSGSTIITDKDATNDETTELATYVDEEIGVTFEYPASWREATCEGFGGAMFLIEKEDVKCQTEDSVDGPIIFKIEQKTTSCDKVVDNDLQTSNCEITKFGDNNVLVASYTYIKDGEFGETTGTVFRQVFFLDESFDNLCVNLTEVPDSALGAWESTQQLMASMRLAKS